MTHSIEEILDIVDGNDQVIGSLPRSKIYEQGNFIIRGAWLFIQNSKGELWIPRRVKTKKLFPDALDGSAVGHVSSGESYEVALLREAKEELNIDVSIEDLHYVGSMKPQQLPVLDKGLKAFVKVYKLQSDVAPNFNRDDYSEYYWLTPQELLRRIDAGEKYKNSLPFIVKHLFC